MNRWNVLPSTIWKPSASTSALSSPFTVALVASGTNAGVSTSPCAQRRTPARALPSRASIRKTSRSAVTRAAYEAGRPRRPLALRLPLGGRALERGVAVAVAVRGRLADWDAARLALLRLRDPDLEHAVRERRLDLLAVDPVGQSEVGAERAELALDSVEAALLLGVLRLALAGDRERAVVQLDVHVALGQAGQ